MNPEEIIKQCHRIKKVLVIKTNFLGDVLNFLPVVNFLGAEFKLEWLGWLVTETGYPVVKELAKVDEILLLKNRLFYSWKNLYHLARWLKEKKPDLIVTSPQEECGLISTLALLSRAPLRIGYNLRRRGWFFNIVVPKGSGQRRVELNGEIIRLLGGKLEDYFYIPRADPEQEQSFFQKLETEAGLKEGSQYCVLHLFSSKRIKSWRWEYGEELILGIKNLGLIPIMVGSEPETRRWAEARKNLGLINLAGQISLIELYYLLRRARLFIGIDSFPWQLTEFAGTQAIGLFGSTEVGENRVPGAEVVKAEVECAPCWPERMECELDYKCWRELKPEQILAVAEKLLARVGA